MRILQFCVLDTYTRKIPQFLGQEGVAFFVNKLLPHFIPELDSILNKVIYAAISQADVEKMEMFWRTYLKR